MKRKPVKKLNDGRRFVGFHAFPSLVKKIQELADSEGRSLSSQIVKQLEKSFQQ